jgi:hypothetical protein
MKYKIRLSNTARNDPSSASSQYDFEIDQGWDTNLWYPAVSKLGPRQDYDESGGKPGEQLFLFLILSLYSYINIFVGYWQEGFLMLQRAIDMAIIELSANQSEIDVLTMDKITSPILLQRYAYPPFIDNPFILVAQQYLPMVFVLSFALSVLYIIRSIVTEKEKRLKVSSS